MTLNEMLWGICIFALWGIAAIGTPWVLNKILLGVAAL